VHARKSPADVGQVTVRVGRLLSHPDGCCMNDMIDIIPRGMCECIEKLGVINSVW